MPPTGPPFDLLSLNVGSRPTAATIPGAREFAIPAKPVDEMIVAWQRLRADLIESPRPHRIVVVGGGAGGVELTLTMQHQLARDLGDHGSRIAFTLITSSDDIMPTHNAGVRRRMNRVLRRRNIELLAGETATEVTPDEVRCESGRGVPYDTLIWTTHAAPAPWLAETGLALDDRGFVLVDAYLRSVSHPFVFAGGDVATLRDTPRPKSGVFAVREGPFLAENIRRTLAEEPLERFRPQREFLSLVSTGDKNAIASRGRFHLEGKLLWRWKDHIDRRFMERYAFSQRERMDRMRQMERDAERDGTHADSPAMRCNGCGAKIGHSLLQRALERLETATHPDVLIGLDAPDDAAVVEIPHGQLAVQTIDFFPAIVDDPYTFGEITAHHCMNDLYAMGATPHTALAMVTLPKGDALYQEDTLTDLLAGALAALMAENATLVGGHTVEGDALTFGLSMQGLLSHEIMLREHAPAPGDVLILTKPLGAGVVFAADMQGRAETPWVNEAIASMRQSNHAAAKILCRQNPAACTDVTGFGLVGHLMQLLDDVQYGAEIALDRVPVFHGALEAARQGFRSSLYPTNAAYETHVETSEVLAGTPAYSLLFDPQTGGGLLSAVPADRADDCLRALKETDYAHATAIGRLITRPKNTPPVVLR